MRAHGVEEVIRTTLQYRWLWMRERDIRALALLVAANYPDRDDAITCLTAGIEHYARPRYRGRSSVQ
jgi:hypothetical protein